MTRIIQQHPTLARRSLSRLVLAVVTLLLTTSTAHAAFTTSACLVQKRKAWITFRKCQGSEQVKQLKGKPTDLTACDPALQTALTKISAKATKALIPCRYRDNADSTITDYDTGLMWEKKTAGNVNTTFAWSASLKDFPDGYNACVTSDGSTLACNSAYHDWRLPNIVELPTIFDATQGYCGGGSGACIDPIFGTTVALNYWSATTSAMDPLLAWFVDFSTGFVGSGNEGNKAHNLYVRAVRAGL